MIMVLARYCIVRFNPLELKIMNEGFKDFNYRRYDVKEESTRIIRRKLSKKESRRRIKKLRDQYKMPTRENYQDLQSDFAKYFTYTTSGRFFHAHHDWDKSYSNDSYGKDVDVRLWEKDPQILIDVVTNYNKVESIEKIPKNLVENKAHLTIYKHHVEKLIKELKEIDQAMHVQKISEMDYA